MKKTRLEALTDGVIAIILTIMVLELKVPHDTSFDALVSLVPVFLSYVLSFLYVAIYWNNHHHLFQIVRKVSGHILWANMVLIFFLTLIPFSTGWVSENHIAGTTMFLYGLNLLCCALAYMYLVREIVSLHGKQSDVAKALKMSFKGPLSLIGYVVGIAFSFIVPQVSALAYVAVALMWFIPDRTIEKHVIELEQSENNQSDKQK